MNSIMLSFCTGSQDKKAMRLHRNIMVCSGLAVASCVTHIYGAFGVFGIYSDLVVVPAWPWWVFQTLMRLEEILMAVLVFKLAGKAKKVTQNSDAKQTGISKMFHSAIERINPSGRYARRKQVTPLTSATDCRGTPSPDGAKKAWARGKEVTSCVGSVTVGDFGGLPPVKP